MKHQQLNPQVDAQSATTASRFFKGQCDRNTILDFIKRKEQQGKIRPTRLLIPPSLHSLYNQLHPSVEYFISDFRAYSATFLSKYDHPLNIDSDHLSATEKDTYRELSTAFNFMQLSIHLIRQHVALRAGDQAVLLLMRYSSKLKSLLLLEHRCFEKILCPLAPR